MSIRSNQLWGYLERYPAWRDVWILIQTNFNLRNDSHISPATFHFMSWACIIVLHFREVIVVLSCLSVLFPLGKRCFRRCDRWHWWRLIAIFRRVRQANPLEHIQINPHSRFCSLLLHPDKHDSIVHVIGSWTHSFAWADFVLVNSWNHLAWVATAWALLCLLIHPCLLCLRCLESCRVWSIWTMNWNGCVHVLQCESKSVSPIW